MGWGRIDDGFDDHPKVLAILDEDDSMEAGLALGLWTLCFTWAHRNTRRKGKTPGLLPPHLPRRFFGPAGKRGAELLVKHGLWRVHESGGWMIHDFDDYLPTEQTKAARAAAGRRGAAKRWAGHKPETHSDDPPTRTNEDGTGPPDDGNLPTGDDNEPSPSHGGATRPLANDGSRTPAHRAISKEIAPTPTPVPPSAGAEAPTGDAAAIHAGTIVAAYSDGAAAARMDPPSGKLRARVGRDARRLLDEGKNPERLVVAAYEMGGTEFNDLDVAYRRAEAADKRGANGSGTGHRNGSHGSPAADRLAAGMALAAKLDAEADQRNLVSPPRPKR